MAWPALSTQRPANPHYSQQRLPGAYSLKASPVAASGKLYIPTEQGDVIVLRMGKNYEVLAVNKMGEEIFISSPVIHDGNLYLRSEDELFCITAD